MKNEVQSPPKPGGPGPHTWLSGRIMKGYNLGVRINQREKEGSLLYWDQRTFFSQGQMINILDFGGHTVSAVTPQLCCCSMKANRNNM